jgi:hypothetical protein
MKTQKLLNQNSLTLCPAEYRVGDEALKLKALLYRRSSSWGFIFGWRKLKTEDTGHKFVLLSTSSTSVSHEVTRIETDGKQWEIKT